MTDAPPSSPALQPSQPKVDPETLVLRGAPARVTRFRRGAIIGIAAAAASAIVIVGWLALQPARLGIVLPDEERNAIAAKAPSDALAGAPASYGDVPKLGPPLPGDLGRPILARQRELEAEMAANPATEAGADAKTLADQQAEAERQRAAAEERAARAAGVMVPIGKPAPLVGAAMLAEAAPSRQGSTGQRRKEDLVGATSEGEDVNPHRLVEPVSPWTLHAGSVIAASLITGVNSDLPGLVTAQVTENVYDSVTGQRLLIPQGARLVGRYDSVIAFGQSRALLLWERILLPDGSSIQIDNVPATDTRGYAGLSDKIDRHSWQILKGVVLSTLLGVGTELGAGSSDNDLVEALRDAAQQSGARAGDQLVGRSLDIQPTLTVRPGWPLRVVVHKDIVLRPWGGKDG